MSGYLLYILLLLLGLVYGLAKYNLRTRPGKLLTQLLGLILFFELLNFLLPYYIQTNRPTFHLLTFGQIIYCVLIYREMLQNSISRKIVVYTGILALSGAVANSFFIAGLHTYPSANWMLLSLSVFTGVLLHFKQMLQNPELISIYRQAPFWFNCGNIIFYGLTFFVGGYLEVYYRNGLAPLGFWGWELIQFCNFILYSAYLYTLHLEVHSKSTELKAQF